MSLRAVRLGTQYQSHAVFFFSSRRRHTRLQGDWSSDVCSSDLAFSGSPLFRNSWVFSFNRLSFIAQVVQGMAKVLPRVYVLSIFPAGHQIGRASCRERV